MPRFVKWMIAGLIGGVIGAAIWTVVGYFTGCEVGWIAIGIGFIVGAAVRTTTEADDGVGPGIAAAGMAALAVLVGKYFVVSLVLSNAMAENPIQFEITSDEVVSAYAWEILEEQATPEQMNAFYMADDTDFNWDFPPQVKAKAKAKWDGLSPDEQASEIAATQVNFENEIEKVKSEVVDRAFNQSFSPFDLLWFGLAIVTAFKVTSGMNDD